MTAAAPPGPAARHFLPFAVLDRALDSVFGPAGNPLRHLGALGFYFFWIAVASGLYLYVFFDTGVDGAYRSVERLTREQWYAGGVMRSLHRYSSDAFLAAVGLHFLKELAGRRFSGFRWFSWVSGVPLVPLALASGIVGYWLVWDELAQFVAVATADWFGALPALGGALTRNFIAPEAVSDRFFTLLVFLHVGIPLALLAGMFVHVQRVNYADIAPARGLAGGTLAALLALSVASP
ncbi:MAG TPA: cytochrome b N-terminal domain-containing protein, partial [Burkholderiales bacterium]|nr:cytochrome b N-terminal domain-containing protein [Burkholderiales bacterium]